MAIINKVFQVLRATVTNRVVGERNESEGTGRLKTHKKGGLKGEVYIEIRARSVANVEPKSPVPRNER